MRHDTVPARFLSEAQVEHLLPDPLIAVALARRALLARADGTAQVPPKPTIQLAGAGFANAMPAAILEEGLVGAKWVSIVPDNPGRGLATAQGLLFLVDAGTGALRCIMQAGALTALRTAAVTGACLDALARRDETVCFLGTGEQARSHLAVLDALGFTDVLVWGRRPEALDELSDWAAKTLSTLRPRMATDREDAVAASSVLVTGLSIGLEGTRLDPDLVRPEALLLPLDYASCIGPDLARTARLVSDDVEQFRALAPTKLSPDYPLPSDFTGTALSQPRGTGRLLCQNLGNGSSDLVIAGHVASAAEAAGVGTLLPS
ncbi:hypothetical protein [Luteococcus sp.]|uniref:hypothetical protein n=1 Tax=Luteococcus sp. TaxID=1969402 RepID=UPI003735D10A